MGMFHRVRAAVADNVRGLFGKPDGRERRSLLATQVSVETIIDCCYRVAVQYGALPNAQAIRNRHFANQRQIPLSLLLEFSAEFELELEPIRTNWDDLFSAQWKGPLILILDNANAVMVKGFRHGEVERIAVSDPMFNDGQIFFLLRQELESSWGGVALVTAKSQTVSEASREFGLSWFTQKLWKEKRLMRDVFLSSLTMHLVSLTVPLFFQILLDRVLPSHAMTTLISVSSGVVVFLLFNAGFTYLRYYLLAHLGRKFELVISSELVEHMMSLPVDYFHRHSTGVLVHKISEANKVREFLANKLLNTFLDSTCLLVYLPAMAIYSVKLACVVLGIASLNFVVLTIASKRFRKQVLVAAAIDGRRKSYFLEMINGINTIKSFAIESQCLRRWRRYSGESALQGLELGQTSSVTRGIMTGLERLLPVVVGITGVLLVMDEQMTVGALVAFNMLSYRVASPLKQCSTVLQDYQSTLVSLAMLGELFKAEPESTGGQLVPPIRGAIEFDNVSFAYSGQTTPALDGLSFRIEPGQTIGIIGRSGSGKTTITRLLQKFYEAQGGALRLDGHELHEIETNYLRSQIGVVLQEAFFFSGTVRDNIALSRPEASMDEIVQAAKMAGAHEFVQRLPYGYMTRLEENGGNLSGGQRQRLAIARVLLNRPRLLIFDEATSALDPESELVVRQAMKAICKGRTAIIVTHRLSFVRDADQIMVMDGGRLAAMGPHDRLLKTSPLYARFWQQQAGIYS